MPSANQIKAITVECPSCSHALTEWLNGMEEEGGEFLISKAHVSQATEQLWS